MLTAQPSSGIPNDSSGDGAHSSDGMQQTLLSSNRSSKDYSNLGQSNSSQPVPLNIAEDVATKNNRVLARTCLQLNNFTTYGLAIDEFYQWCRDERAYHPLNEQAILKCLEIIKTRAPEWGMWSALRVFSVAVKHKDRLSTQFSVTVSEWYDQLKGEGENWTSSKTSAAYSTSQPLSPLSAGDAAPPQSAPQHVGQSTSPQIHHSQQYRYSSSYPSPPISYSNSQTHSPSSVMAPPRPSTVTVRSTGPVYNNIPQGFSPEYQQQLLQWQHLWFKMQQQKGMMPIFPAPIPAVHQMSRQALNQPNRHPTLVNQSIPINQNSSLAKLRGSNQSTSQGMPILNRPPVNIPVTRQAVPAPVTAPSVISASCETINNGYMRPLCRAIQPFRPQHDHPIANVNITIHTDIFQRLWMRTAFKLPPSDADDKLLPISFILNSWKANGAESKCEWPEKVDLAVNGAAIAPLRKRKVQLPNKPQNMHMMVGKDRPLDLTAMLMPGVNSVTIKQNECACGYYFGITLYLRETEQLIRARAMARKKNIIQGQQLVNKLIGIKENVPVSPLVASGRPQQSPCSLNQTINQSLPSNDDDDIECLQDSVKVSLRCPISLLRIKEPVKGINCCHVECFDLASYLCVNQGLSTWKCPVCSKFTTSASLIYDEYFAQLLEDMDENITEAEYSRMSRSWKPVSFAVEDDDDGSDGDEPPQYKSTPVQSLPVASKRKPCQELVNLISDDEDDNNGDNPPAKRSKMSSTVEQQDNNGIQSIIGQTQSSQNYEIFAAEQAMITYPPLSTGLQNNSVPFLHLPGLMADNSPPANHLNIPSTAISNTTSSSNESQIQEPLNATSYPPDLTGAVSSPVTAAVLTSSMSYPTNLTLSLDPQPIVTQSPYTSSRNPSVMSTPAFSNTFKNKAPCSIYLPKKKLPRS